MGPRGAEAAIIPCTFGIAALISPLFILIGFSPKGLMLLLTFMIPIAVYLFFGLVMFFESRMTNIPIQWTKNGGW